jgi:hypothetical protein
MYGDKSTDDLLLCTLYSTHTRQNLQNLKIGLVRRKIRLIESNAKCRYLTKFTCKETLRQVFYLSEAPSPLMTHSVDPTLYTCIQST